MEITRNSLETMMGPADWFTGNVYVDTVAVPTDASRVSAAVVHFAPGGRTAWHTHPHGQTIFVTEGVGRCQRRGGLAHSSGWRTDSTDAGLGSTWSGCAG